MTKKTNWAEKTAELDYELKKLEVEDKKRTMAWQQEMRDKKTEIFKRIDDLMPSLAHYLDAKAFEVFQRYDIGEATDGNPNTAS